MHLELLLFILTSTAICLGCLVPARWLPPLHHDKWMHFFAFATLSALAKLVAGTPKELALWLFGLLFAGLAIEILQNWVPGRKFCWKDMAANTAGIFIIAAISCLLN
ncbi:VanZ family protein [Undibacterium sp.]|uniref:VanZ family protein n=1 Tax=Undibacterium sp. TaxID=1914977 RepID=UPI00374DCAB4